jgi:hypothetical protein
MSVVSRVKVAREWIARLFSAAMAHAPEGLSAVASQLSGHSATVRAQSGNAASTRPLTIKNDFFI